MGLTALTGNPAATASRESGERCRLTASKPILNPELKAPTASALEAKHDDTFSNVVFNINLRRYIVCDTAGRWRNGGKAV